MPGVRSLPCPPPAWPPWPWPRAGSGWLVALATASSGEELARLDRWLLGLGLLVLAAWTASRLNASPGYATDEASFEQGAASLLLHGHDPYGANLTSALAAFSTPSKYLTYTMIGWDRHHVRLSGPAAARGRSRSSR